MPDPPRSASTIGRSNPDDLRDEDPVHLRLVLWRAAKAVEEVDRASIASTGLGLSDFAVLEVLLHKGPAPVNALGRRVLLTSGSITTAVDRLQQRGLVRRMADPDDRRVCLVHLTTSGRRLIESAFATHAANLERAFAGVTPSERRRLTTLLRKLGKGAAAAMTPRQ